MNEMRNAEWERRERELTLQVEGLQARLIATRLRTLDDIEQVQRLLRESRAMVDESKKMIRRSRKQP